jgi:hypothetical protein
VIPAPPGLVALYKHDSPEHHTEMTIVAFDDDGHPLVIDKNGKRNKTQLIRADSWANYDGMADDPYPSITAIMPAGGWRVEWTDSDGTIWSEPLAGWGLKGDAVVPLSTDSTGLVDDFDLVGGKWRIYHPDATATAPAAHPHTHDVPASGGAARKGTT